MTSYSYWHVEQQPETLPRMDKAWGIQNQEKQSHRPLKTTERIKIKFAKILG